MMTKGTHRVHRNAFCASTALGLTLINVAPVLAQEIIDIPAQPLSEALTELANETGLKIVTSPTAIKGLTSRAVSGPMTPQAALREMLTDTELSIRMPEEDGAVLSFGDVVSQNTASEEPFELETLILQSQLIPTTLAESEVSAVIVTGETLEASGESSVRDIFNRVPNASNFSGDGDFTIRGVTADGVSGGDGEAISYQYDGVPLPRIARELSPVSLWDVEQVEVLRGPQSTQQGRNASAGAVIVQSNDPIFGSESAVRVGAGTFNAYQFALMTNQELIPGQLAFRLSGERSGNDGSLTRISDGATDADRTELESIRAAIRWAPTDDLDVVLSFRNADLLRGEERVAGALDAAGNPIEPPRLTPYDFPAIRDHHYQQLGLDLSWNINPTFTLEYNFDFATSDIDYQLDRAFPSLGGAPAEELIA